MDGKAEKAMGGGHLVHSSLFTFLPGPAVTLFEARTSPQQTSFMTPRATRLPQDENRPCFVSQDLPQGWLQGAPDPCQVTPHLQL